MNLIPVINTKEGLSLTAMDWQEIGIMNLACNLENLLFKPGLEFFNKNYQLKNFFNFFGTMYLDISSLSIKDGCIQIKSPYDGSKIKLSLQDLFRFIVKLAPDFIIINKDWNEFKEVKTPLLNTGIDFYLSETLNISNIAAFDGYNGNVYTKSGNLQISSESFHFDFSLLDKTCKCPTCQQSFTRSYLNHLFIKVPLLCQRYLIKHNIYFLKNHDSY